MKALAQFVGKALEALVVFILSVMSILVFLNVVLRYGFNSSISVTEEVSRYMFIWLTFLAAVLAFSENRHVNVTILTDKLSPNRRNILGILTDSIMLYCCYLIVDGSWIQFQLNWANLAPISGLPQGITYLASVVAGTLIGLLLIARLISRITLLTKGEKA
ncbi:MULTISPECIES: TRAP transporter small permease [Rodentibacter]|uniref:TRAP transporter small permease protein n=1 Tax=Rodentibacter rarus TaxID=1908260 RepID=A0A1V3IR45_9PAST|nr:MULTISPECIES: TRAP transporter small permease [Rodentibacter]OOF40412.1 C4-dicarboxylate ABC transporter permease [Rodentibacter rarus]OOF44389.1 C4-dicarboxylate ABC transporter permease [Rodentibacter rarus]OOF52493.1 C4-dicarboxylate ABC transporter permease [Rodentibacter trehalosifermentans]